MSQMTIHSQNHPHIPKKSQSNCPSKLLSDDENEILFRTMGSRCQAQVSAVVQVFFTEPPSHSMWNKQFCGVATFTKDSNRRSYFIQVFDVLKETKLFEQEIYNQFSYHPSAAFFHQFESENHMVGLNFADNQEADNFHLIISERLASKQRKKEERRRQHQQHDVNLKQQQSNQRQQHELTSLPPSQSASNQSLNARPSKQKKGKKATKLRKEQISQPMDFKHITHVGFDQDKGLSFNDNASGDNLNQFFKMAGVSDKLLQDDNTRKFIYDFIEKNGGLERAEQETKTYGSIKRPPPPPDSQAKPILPSRNSTGAAPPPPPPPRPPQLHPLSAPPPPPKDRSVHDRDRAAAPPPPPPPRGGTPGAKPLPKMNGGPAPPPPPPVMGGGTVPVPPPPPPPPGQPPPIAMPTPAAIVPTPKAVAPVSMPHNDLLAQIRDRPTLTPVTQTKRKPIETDSRTTLMSEIRKREYELKPVTTNEGDVSPSATSTLENTMAGMLARALEGRAKAIQSESDTDDEEEEDEDEWDE